MRVRSRLVAGVALVGITVVAAGAPAVFHASSELNDAQSLVTLAELNQRAVTLGHSLADERDEVVVHIAAGRDEQPGGTDKEKAEYRISEIRSARVDRQSAELRATSSAPPGLLRDLATVPSIRRTALTGTGSALAAYRAYSEVIDKLQTLADELAERIPAEAADGIRAPAALGRAVEQASATRGLLLAALAVESSAVADAAGTSPYDPVTGLAVESSAVADGRKNDRLRDELSTGAQKSRVRELAALDDFDRSAGTEARDSLAATVTGPEVKTAEGYLARLTDRPELSGSDRGADQEKVEAALSARIEQMRGVESGLGSSRLERLEKLRDDDVTALELGIALLGGCLIIAVGVSTAVARTLTRPLAVVRIGAARLSAAPDTEEPIRFTGRNDEFAQVVRSVNALHGKLLALSGRADRLDSDRGDLLDAREKVTEQRVELQDRTAELRHRTAELRDRTAEFTAQLQGLRHTVQHTFVNLSLRTLGLVERQLGVIEVLEEREQDTERLAALFRLDHMATVMRRHSENLLVLAGYDHGHGCTDPVPLVDVARAAVSEIERYERVTIQSLPPHAQVAGFAADDLSHLVAELLENATAFSPPDTEVQLFGRPLESGGVMLSVQDRGVGMSVDRIAEFNARLADPETPGETPRGAYGGGPESEGLGLRVAALLGARHGVTVELRERHEGGLAALVVLPAALLPPVSPSAAVPDRARTAADGFAISPPGSAAETGSHVSGPPSGRDPLVVAAEAAIRKAEQRAAAEAEADTARAARRAAETEQGPRPEPAGVAPTGAGSVTGAVAVAPEPGPFGIGPDSHERVPDGAPEATGIDGIDGIDQDTVMMRLPRQPDGAGTADADGAADTAALRGRLGEFSPE